MKHPLQTERPTTEQPAGAVHRSNRALQISSPYFTTAEACEHLRYTGRHRLRSLYRFIEHEGIRPRYRGRRLLIRKDDVAKALAERKETA